MRQDTKETLVCALLILAGIIAAVMFFTGNVDTSRALRALGAQGVTNVTLTGYKFFGCDSREYHSTGFKGTGANGKPVSGVVCSGVFKGVTVRYD